MNPHAQWKGRAVSKARHIVATQMMPGPCGKCGKTVTVAMDWAVGHKLDRWSHPHLTWEVSNWQPEHRSCSNKSGQAAVIAKAKAEALAEVGIFPSNDSPRKSRPLPVSPPEVTKTDPINTNDGINQPILNGLNLPQPAVDGPATVRPGLEWDPDYLLGFEWLAELAVVPDDASPPLYMTPVHPEAVGSYGAELIEWAETEHNVRLRWWQRLAVTRQLEHRADGSLVYRDIVESAPRRAGKSVRMRMTALWRLARGPELFSEIQLVMHTGSDIPICREIQRGAWRWAETQDWEVTRANGKEAIETPTGDRWLVRSQDGVYGYDVTLGLVDEGWNVKPDTVSEGIEPATLERSSPQVHKTSTAHRRATSLMRKAIKDALTIDNPEVLLIMWAAPAGSDPSDPAVWRAASPHWSPDRERMIAAKYEAALAGQADPQADDPDPMAGFVAQYLNVWRLDVAREAPGEPITTTEDWDQLAAAIEHGPLAGAAIESWFGRGVSVTLAHQTPDGIVHLVTTDHATLAAAVGAVTAYDSRCKVTVGSSLADDPAVKPLGRRLVKGQGRAGAAATELARYINEAAFTHDNSELLTDQVLALRTQPSPDGPRIVSKGRADAIKSAVWAIGAARAVKRGKPRIITLT